MPNNMPHALRLNKADNEGDKIIAVYEVIDDRGRLVRNYDGTPMIATHITRRPHVIGRVRPETTARN